MLAWVGFFSSFQGQWRKVDHQMWVISLILLLSLEDEHVSALLSPGIEEGHWTQHYGFGHRA